jgi:hypothetical protein
VQVWPFSGQPLARMEHAKLTNENGHELPVGRSRFSVEQEELDAARSAGKKVVRKNLLSHKGLAGMFAPFRV